MTLYEIWKNKHDYYKTHGNEEGIFYNSDLLEIPFMKEYVVHGLEIDRNLLIKYGQREFDIDLYLFDNFVTDELLKPVYVIRDIFKGFLYTNRESWERIYNAIQTKYEPLNNYDKTSTITTEFSGKEKNITDSTNTLTYAGSEVDTMVRGNDVVETENTVSAFDSTVYSPSNKSTTTNHENTDTNTRTYNNRNDKNVGNNTETKEFIERKDTVTERTFGNIGVTTNDKMLSEFLEQRAKLDFYDMLFSKFLLEYSW